MPVVVIAIALAALLLCGLCVAFFYRRTLFALLREPVWFRPVIVLESDDWGAGPTAQAEALLQVAACLLRHRDRTGRYPVMSLAIVLAIPDGELIASTNTYACVDLGDRRFEGVRDALLFGTREGVFTLQLHGFEHYAPEALMRSRDAAVFTWLRSPFPAATELLPPPLQTRWVYSDKLPSVPADADFVKSAVAQEVLAFKRVFGRLPEVVVPPTFVWTRAVEEEWARNGVVAVITPGFRSTQRDALGMPSGDEGPIVNGDRFGGLTYLARTDYFEPMRGRGAKHALRALARDVLQGRPCVLENHRDSFIFDADDCRRSLGELDALCSGALTQQPGLRFLSTSELANILRDRDPDWVAQDWRVRLPYLWERMRHSGRPWRMMRITGWTILGSVLVGLLGVSRTSSAVDASS